MESSDPLKENIAPPPVAVPTGPTFGNGGALPPDAYDSPWKEMLEHAFPEFMAFFFPEAYQQIDWTRGHEFLPVELRQVVRDAELGKRFADALVRVFLADGQEEWLYIHIEIQGQPDRDFARRIFVYN